MNRPLTLYSRQGCHLCEQMLAEIRGLYGAELAISLVDVDTDALLLARYGLKVPVLAGEEGVISSGRLDAAALEDYLTTH